MIVKKSRDPEADLNALRERLGLYENVPVLEHVHVGAIAPLQGQVAICCHDAANDDTHLLIFDADTSAENPWGEALGEDGEITHEMQVRCEHALRAAYN